MVEDPFAGYADVVVLDGGLATELEARGADLSDDLWSARLLLDDPQLIVDVHRAYVDAGADVVIGASYQASFDGAIRHFVDCLESGAPFETDAADNLQTLRLVEDAYSAAAVGRPAAGAD